MLHVFQILYTRVKFNIAKFVKEAEWETVLSDEIRKFGDYKMYLRVKFMTKNQQTPKLHVGKIVSFSSYTKKKELQRLKIRKPRNFKQKISTSIIFGRIY